MGGTGLGKDAETREKPQSTLERSNFVATAGTVDRDLALIAARWPRLTKGTKKTILAMVRQCESP